MRRNLGHGAAFRHAACQLGGLALDQVPRLSMFHARPVYLERVSDREWRHLAGEWRVRSAAEAAVD